MAASNSSKQIVVLDKSFVQGAPSFLLQNLNEKYEICITTSFYYEVFTNLDASRLRVLASLPEFRRIHSQLLYLHEKHTGTPATAIETELLTVNPNVISGARKFTADEKEAIERYRFTTVEPSISFWEEAMKIGIPGFSEKEEQSVRSDLHAFISLASRITNADFIRDVAMQLGYPHSSLLNDEWYTFRHLQTLLLHVLILRNSYPHPSMRRSRYDLEHDVHDMDYLSAGLHSKCFATNESAKDHRKLGWKFKFLCPQGRLIQSIKERGESKIIEIQ